MRHANIVKGYPTSLLASHLFTKRNGWRKSTPMQMSNDRKLGQRSYQILRCNRFLKAGSVTDVGDGDVFVDQPTAKHVIDVQLSLIAYSYCSRSVQNICPHSAPGLSDTATIRAKTIK